MPLSPTESVRPPKSLRARCAGRHWLAALALATAPLADAQVDGWTVERSEARVEMEAGGAVKIRNEFGDLRVRETEDPEVLISAVVQKRDDVDAEAAVGRRMAQDALEIEVRFPDGELPEPLRRPAARPDRRVDLVVYVPVGSRIEARTWSGLIEVREVAGDVDLATESGEVRLSTSGAARIATDRGAVLAAFRSTAWNGESSIQTVTGEVRVELPTTAALVATLSTQGEITTDYSLAIERRGRLKTAVARIAEGGRTLDVRSRKGAIALVEGLP